jgi:hypothetical protein
MAEVFVQQGLYDQAREIYQRLMEQKPGDPLLTEKLAQLGHRASVPADTGTGASRFSVAATGGESAVSFLKAIFQPAPATDAGAAGDAGTTDEPETAAPESSESSVLASAFGAEPTEPPGSPTIPASDEVSLSSVFGGEPPSPVSPDVAEPPAAVEESDSVSFDEFYGSPPESLPTGGAEETEPGEGEEEGDDDFKNWLEGLKT